MRKNRLLLAILSCTILFFGCSKESQSHYYITHPQVFKETLQNCVENMTPENTQSYECKTAIALYKNLVILTKQLIESPENFGRRILSLQTDIAALQTQFNTAKRNKDEKLTAEVKQKLARLCAQLEVMLALVAATESPGS